MEMLEFARSARKSVSRVEASLSTAEGTVRGIDVDELKRVLESREITNGEKVETGFLSKEASNDGVACRNHTSFVTYNSRSNSAIFVESRIVPWIQWCIRQQKK